MAEDEQYSDLCKQMVTYCDRRQWFGPDDGLDSDRSFLDSEGALQTIEITHDARKGFEFPPATPAQIRETETVLGFALPPLLCAIYMSVANGGFGPGQGLTGASGGYAYGNDDRYNTIEGRTAPIWATVPLDLAEFEMSIGAPRRYALPLRAWPTRFLHLCYWGCGADFYLDPVSGCVYCVGGGPGDYETALDRQENSRADWFETWLRGEWRTWFPQSPDPMEY
jgi:SMI1 / KNR4 family (SUKH-1)